MSEATFVGEKKDYKDILCTVIYGNKLDNLDDRGKFLEKHKLSKLTAGAVQKSKQTCNK